MTTPAERLCSRSWRLRNSAWLLPAILLVGLFTWASFLYIGIKARKKQWLVASGIFGAGAVLMIALNTMSDDGSKDTSTAGETIAGMVIMVVWIGGLVYGAISNREWLKRKAHADEAGPWYAPGTSPPVQPVAMAEPNVDDILLGSGQRPTTTQMQPPPPPPPPPSSRSASASGFETQPAGSAAIDLNGASSVELQTALGLNASVADRIVLERELSGGFTNAEELLTTGAVEPHVFTGIRSRVVVGPRPDSRPPSSRGRRLDL